MSGLFDETLVTDIGDQKLDHPIEAHRGTLLARLREAYETGPRLAPFDGNRAWSRIFHTFRFQDVETFVAKLPRPGKPDVRRYDQIAKALKKAHALLVKDNEADTGGDVMDFWWEENMTPVDSLRAPIAEIQQRYDAAVAAVGQLARAAEDSAKHIRSRKKPGKPRGGAQLPDQIIIALAAIFKACTGVLPTVQNRWGLSGKEIGVKTPFELFIDDYVYAIGGELTDRSLVEAIERARASSLKPENQEWGPSPFKA